MGSWKSTMFFSRPSESHSVTPTRSPSASVSRYCDEKAASSAAAVAGGDGVCARFLVGRARAVRRKSMKDDLPQPLVPMTRMLCAISLGSARHGVGGLLEGRGVLPPSHAPRAVDGADLAARVAVPAPVGHALRPGVGVEGDEPGGGGGGAAAAAAARLLGWAAMLAFGGV
jgi:hypothetical protein